MNIYTPNIFPVRFRNRRIYAFERKEKKDPRRKD